MVDVEIAGESTRAFQLQLKPHLLKHESQQTSQTTQSDHQELDISMEVIRILAEMKSVVIVYEHQQLGIEQLKQGCEVIQASEATNLIQKYGNTGYSSLLRGELKQALVNLRRADVILNALVASESNVIKEPNKQNQIDIDLVYFIKGNLGVCFYRAGLLEEAFTCFQTCGLALEKRATSPLKKENTIMKVSNTVNASQTNNLNSQNLGSPMNAIQKQMLVRFNFQSCILRSEQGKHERAITYARKGLSAVISQILELYSSIVLKLIQKRNNPKRIAVTPRNSSSNGRQNGNSNNNQQYDFEDNNYYGFNLPTERSRQHSISFSTHTTRTLSSEESAKKIEQLYPVPRSLKSLEFDLVNKSKVLSTDSNDRLLNEQKRARSSSIDQQQQQSLKAFPQSQQQHLLPYFPSKSQKNSLESQERKDKSESDDYQSEEQYAAATLTREEKNLLMILKQMLLRCQDLGDLIADQEQFNFLTSIPLPFTESLTISQVFQSANNLLSKSNILSLLQLKPFSFSSLKNNLQQTTSISDKFAILASQLTVSFYCLSTECRFIEQETNSPQNNNSKQSSSNRLNNYFSSSEISDSENYLSRALEIAFIYLPHDLPLVGQIICVHSKFHAAFRQTIQEDTPDLSSHVLLRPLPGGTKFPQFIPLIRKRTEKQQQQSSFQEITNSNQNSLVTAIQNTTKHTLEQFSDTPIYSAEGLSKERINNSKRQPLLEKNNKSALNSIIQNGNTISNIVLEQQSQVEKSEQLNKSKITNEKQQLLEQYPISKETEYLGIRRTQIDGSRADSGISVRSELGTADKDKKREQIDKINQISATQPVKVRKQLFKNKDDFRETQSKMQLKESQQQQQLQLLEQPSQQQEEQQNSQIGWRINLQQSILQRRQNHTLDPPSSTRNKKRSSEDIENSFSKPKQIISNMNNIKVSSNQQQREVEVKASLKYLNNFLKNPQQVPQRILNPSHLGVKNPEININQQIIVNNNHRQQQKTEQFIIQQQNVNVNHQLDMNSQAEKHQQQLHLLSNTISDTQQQQQQPPHSFRSKQKTPTLQIQNNISFFLPGNSYNNNSTTNNSFIKSRGIDTPINPPQSASSRSSPDQAAFNNTSKAFPKVFTQFKPNTTNFARDQYFNYLSKEQRTQGGQMQRSTDNGAKHNNNNSIHTQKQNEPSNKPKLIQIPFLSIQNSPNSSFTSLSNTINISMHNDNNVIPPSKIIPHSARSKEINSGTQTPLRIRRRLKQQQPQASMIQDKEQNDV